MAQAEVRIDLMGEREVRSYIYGNGKRKIGARARVVERKRKHKGILVEKRIEGEMEAKGQRGKRKRKGVLRSGKKKSVHPCRI